MIPKASRMVLLNDGMFNRWVPTPMAEQLVGIPANIDEEIDNVDDGVIELDENSIAITEDGNCPNCRRPINVIIIED